MNAKKSLYWHFLRIIVPLIVFVFIALISLYAWVNYAEDEKGLAKKLDNLTSTYSLLLAEPVANNSIADIQLYNISLIADPDVAFVVIENAQGDVLEQYGDMKSAQAVGEKMRQEIDNFIFEWEQRSYKLGVSIGIVAITQSADSIQSLIEQADTSCYIAKQKGRNQIHLHTVK